MADGGDLGRSIQGGSDAVFEFKCSPCEDDGSIQEAVKYCPICDQHLCSFCTRQHGRITSSKAHQLSDDLAGRRHRNTATEDVVVAKCCAHPGRVIEMYCAVHDIVCCALCVAKEHRSCNNVDEVSDVAKTHFNKSQFQALLKKLEQMQPKLENTRKKKQDNIEALEDDGITILQEIKDLCDKLNAHIDDLKTKAEQALDKKRTELVEEIKDEISTMDEALNEIKGNKDQISNAGNANIAQQFVQHKLGQSSLSSTERLLDKMNAHDRTHIKFSPNTSLQESVLRVKEMGTIDKESLGEVVTATSTSRAAIVHSWLTEIYPELIGKVPIYHGHADVDVVNFIKHSPHKVVDILIYNNMDWENSIVLVGLGGRGLTYIHTQVLFYFTSVKTMKYKQMSPTSYRFQKSTGKIYDFNFNTEVESEQFAKALQSALSIQSRPARKQ